MKETLTRVIKEAGSELLKHFGTNLEFSVKESRSSIVTKADLKSDALISGILSDSFPSHNIISEESGFSNKGSKYTWVIDPLDGTSNFAAGLPWWGVLIALFENEETVMGAAYLPVSDQLYFAEKGKGATLNGKPLRMKTDITLNNSLISFNVDFTDDPDTLNSSLEIYRRLVMTARNIRCTNCLMDFLYTADGKFGGVINLFTHVWDIAALGLIVKEAGGELRYANGEKIVFRFDDKIVDANFPVVAASAGIISELRNTVLLNS